MFVVGQFIARRVKVCQAIFLIHHSSAVMLTEGHYNLKRITPSEFRSILQDSVKAGNFRSYVGYLETDRLIEQMIGVVVEVSREQAKLEIGDVMLIAKLRYRVPEPANKIMLDPSMDDFEFYYCDWQPITERRHTSEDIGDFSRQRKGK